MKRRSKTEWRELFSGHESSGMTATAFCRERGLDPNYFSLRRKQLLEKDNVTATASFIPVAMTTRSNTPMLELQQGHALVLKIPMSASVTWLVELIQQLQA